MKARTETGGERLFFHALAALLFAAVCAWCASSLYAHLSSAGASALAEAAAPVQTGGGLRGVLLRREERVAASRFPDAKEGERLSAKQTGGESALFFSGGDGWELLTPDDAERLTPERLEALLKSEAREPGDEARLVYGFAQYCAALFEGDAAPAPGPCRLRLEGVEAEVQARLLSVTTDALGRQTLLLRLTDFPRELYEMRFVEGEIVG